MSVGTELDQVLEELRQADKLLLTTHENPDGDALGSLLATYMILGLLGKDVVMFMSENEFPLPWEYRYMPFDGVLHEPPADLDERTVVFLDCGNIDRMPVDWLQQEQLHILNIDHHHDNTRFGTVNLVDGRASCTAEIVHRIAKELGVEITTPIADALYVALVTDTGRFMYENTGPEAHRMAAELIEAGVQPHDVYRRLYEDLPFARLQLLARALSRVRRFDEGALTITNLTREDYEETNSIETDSEGVVDHVRAIEGTAVAGLVRELLAEDRAGTRKVSLRSTDGRVDVSRIARAHGGGGHRQAAGFSTEEPLDELVETLRREVAEQL
ncbi:MAG TPA: bifunctional oligoribonuclease/PAP phosphatase NrnA [Longimicrobiales bacterium]|nr:bifunctional oligoribonuclease/PAP phosphatase NrnA [Longimicrobiales bacterium]